MSGALGVTLALLGYGVWSLVAQSVANNFFRTLLLWILVRWRPSWMFSVESLRTMFAFGSRLLFSGLLETIFNNLYLLVIGRLFSPSDLGYYARARDAQQFPTLNLSAGFGRVTFPVFSAMQDDRPRLKRAVRKAIATLAVVSFPVMIGLAVVARPLVHVVLTQKWCPSVPYLQLLCVVGLFIPLQVVNMNVLKAQGRSDLFLRIEIVKKALVVVAIAVTWQWGITAMIYGQIVTSLISYCLNGYLSGQLLSYRLSEQFWDFFPYLLVACLMGIGVYAIGCLPFKSELWVLTVQVITGGVLYCALCRMARLSAFMEMKSLILAGLYSPHPISDGT